jgi:glutamate-1-semialdehyde 2,1-aminomutase
VTKMSTPVSSESYLERARECMPGGVMATFKMPEGLACVMSHGEGSRIYDLEGNEYIDYLLGSGPMLIGHRHPEVVAALQTQIEKGTTFYTLSPETVELSEMLMSASPCAEAVKLTSSGAEATFYALRIARAATGRRKILKFKGAYHGHHDYAMAESGLRTAGIPAGIEEMVITTTYNDAESACELIERHADELAAVIVEPVQRNTSPRPGFLQALRDATAAHDVVLIFDEMVTGFRIAWGGGQERFGVIPDMATYGKALGGGLPLAAVAGRQDLMEHVNPRKASDPGYVYWSGTLNGNPLAAAAGLATLRVLSAPGTYEELERTGESLRQGLREVAETAKFPLQIVGEGAMAAIIFADGDPLDPAMPGGADAERRSKVEVEMIKRGLFVNMAAAKLYLSTEHDEGQIQATVEVFAESIDATD